MSDKTHIEHNETALDLIADMPRDMDFCCNGPRLCEKAKTLDRDRTSCSFKAAFGAHTQADSSLKTEPENFILVALRLFEFSHSLGHKPTFPC
jgi:hypothetical protein